KGVLVEHRSLANLVRSMIVRPGVDGSDVWAAVTPVSFDIALAEIFVPLVSGAKLVLIERDEAMDPGRLARRLETSGATILQATPATWRMLVADGWKGKRDLRILSGGEALSAELARDLRGRGCEVWNLYGPTETTIWSAIGRVVSDASTPPPLGEPVARTTLHVLDSRLRLAPIGVPGELAIGGAGVARGYLGRPAETDTRFVRNPFGAGRLYRTGDRVRRRVDGSIEFLGRLDDQLKIRGVRVEPAEVESDLEADPDVRRAVVVAAGEPPERRLSAFVQPRATFDPFVIRERLRRRLPEPMIPSEIERVDDFPLTPSGKVDRRALASRSRARRVSGGSPRNPTEELVARTWREVLRLETVGVDQNFFELGGHSLLATRILARLRSTFDVELPLRLLFEQPTVAGLAGEISRRMDAEPA
ncbi:MAG TPA: non-ribosomal peptide synthetase, partial [Thermoanaerobaculia bacterium]|nr:non-ribosomal peptide synthetase [Thermoanaerobaculia bacterium]